MTLDRDSLLDALFQDTQEPVVILDIERNLLDANTAFQGVFGYSKTEITGCPASQLYADAKSAKDAQEEFYDVADSFRSKVLWLSFQRENGTIFNARSTHISIKDADAKITGYVAVIHTLPTEIENLAEGSLNLSDIATDLELHKALYRRTPAILHSIDKNGCIRHVSDAWLERFGYREEEVLGRPSVDFMSEASKESAKRVLADFWQTGYCDNVPYTFLTKTGQPVEIELSAIIDTTDGVSATLAILEDVTDRNRAIRLLEERNDELRDFARVAAHDLQAPLRHISVFSKMIEDELDKCAYEDARENTLLIQTSVSRLRGMVRGLLEFSLSTENRLDIRKTDLNKVLESVLEGAASEISSSKAVVTVEDLPSLPCDGVLIERVIANVIDNALKYVAPGIAPEIQVSATLDTGRCTISISDNGIGISPWFQERIFEPLKRLHGPDSQYAGFGIGLALCRKIVEAHLGQIWVEQNPAGGSTFFIQLGDLQVPAEGDLDPTFEEATGY